LVGQTLLHYRIAAAIDPERLARFEREAGLLASLNHSGIAQLYGFETATLDDGAKLHLIAMELVEGEDLAERLKRWPIPIDEAIAIAMQVAEPWCQGCSASWRRGASPTS
jgi:serine/threonine protein kinase